MTDHVNDPADPAGDSNEPIRLPDDHPLVTAFNAQKERNSGLQTQIDSLTAELDKAKTAVSDPDEPEWKQKFDELHAELAAERETREKAEERAAKAERVQQGVDAGLPKALAELLIGIPDDELDAKIEELKPFIGSGPKPNPQQGNPSQSRAFGSVDGQAEADRRFGPKP